jgi:hypothetical protein
MVDASARQVKHNNKCFLVARKRTSKALCSAGTDSQEWDQKSIADTSLSDDRTFGIRDLSLDCILWVGRHPRDAQEYEDKGGG